MRVQSLHPTRAALLVAALSACAVARSELLRQRSRDLLLDPVRELHELRSRPEVRLEPDLVVLKRSGEHEDTIREMRMDKTGLVIGEPLDGFQGVLTGVPAFVGTHGDLSPKAPGVPPGGATPLP